MRSPDHKALFILLIKWWFHIQRMQCNHFSSLMSTVYLDGVFFLLCQRILLHGLVDCWAVCHSSPTRKKKNSDHFPIFYIHQNAPDGWTQLITFHRVMEVANTGWWSSGHSGCELRLCDASWEPWRWRGTPTREQPTLEAEPDTSLWLG